MTCTVLASRESSPRTLIRQRRPAGAWSSFPCSKNMPDIPRKCWRWPRNVRRRRTTQNVIVVDEDVDPTDFNDVLWALSTRCHPTEDIDFLRNTWSTQLDPSQVETELRPYGSKVLINACKPHRHLKSFPQPTSLRKATYDRVRARWRELGFSEPAPKLTTFHPEKS
jgi:hypothetical protein